jgi:integrase
VTEALKLLAAKIEEVENQAPIGEPGLLKSFADDFIQKNPGNVTERWLHDMKLRLSKAVEFFGTHRDVKSIEPRHIREWLRKSLSDLSGSTQRHYLSALSALYRYGQEVGVVPVGYNPVSGLYRKPSAARTRRRTDEFFEIDAAAKFLDAAVRLNEYPEVIATFLLAGGRRSEVFGLLVGDVEQDNGIVRIQPNEHRGLTRSWSERAVPLWPQLAEILGPYVERREGKPKDLLFPGRRKGMLTDLRKPLQNVSEELGIEVPRLTKFRHTYATARLQTTDNGKQILLWTVAKELGHKTVSRVEDTYGHPNHYRPRGEVVEYRLRD